MIVTVSDGVVSGPGGEGEDGFAGEGESPAAGDVGVEAVGGVIVSPVVSVGSGLRGMAEAGVVVVVEGLQQHLRLSPGHRTPTPRIMLVDRST